MSTAPVSPLTIRPLRTEDDAAVASIIRTVMPSFGADGPGFAMHDPEVAAMSRTYVRAARAAYFVVVEDESSRVVGGGGIAPLSGADPTTCELRKMYFLEEARGRGVGRALLARCLDEARALGFTRCYLETLARMTDARRLYEKAGFEPLDAPMGATGHHGCDRWYARGL